MAASSRHPAWACFRVTAVVGVLAAGAAHAACFDEAGLQYSVNAHLLRGIAQVESGMNPAAIGYNRNKTYDIGLMQINSGWLPALAKFGITELALKTNACLNVKVGAWILASNIQRMGPNWSAVGAYNAACSSLKGAACDSARLTYVNKVWHAMNRNDKGGRTLSASQAAYATQNAQFTERLRQAESRKRLTRMEISETLTSEPVMAKLVQSGPVNDLSDAAVQRAAESNAKRRTLLWAPAETQEQHDRESGQ